MLNSVIANGHLLKGVEITKVYAVTLVQAFFTLFAKSIDNSASYKYKTFIFELETWFKVNGKHLPKDTL